MRQYSDGNSGFFLSFTYFLFLVYSSNLNDKNCDDNNDDDSVITIEKDYLSANFFTIVIITTITIVIFCLRCPNQSLVTINLT